MFRVFTICTLAAGLLPAAPALAGVSPREVRGDRITLADVLPGVSGERGSLDLGPSPDPGESRTLSRGYIRQRLRQAMVDERALRVPRRVRVFRPGQRLTEMEVTRWVRGALERSLPAGAEVRRITPGAGVTLEPGAVNVDLKVPARWRNGRQTIPAEFSTSGGSIAKLLVTVDIALESNSAPLAVRRGQRVEVAARAPGVVIRAKGVVQKDGATGDVVPVLTESGRRVLRARVTGVGSVEVLP